MNADPPGAAGLPPGDLRRVLEGFDVGVVVRRMEAGFSQLPAYTSFAWPVDRGAVVRWNVDLILRWLINGTAPDEYIRSELHELLRARAIAGQPMEDSILVYRRGARLLWEALLDLAKDEDRTVLVAQAGTVWGHLEDYIDLIVDVFAEAYADQGDLPSTAGDRRARSLFDRLCAQLPVTIEDRDRATRLGFDLAAPHCPFAAQLAWGTAAGYADLASRLRAAGALAFTEGARVTGLTAAVQLDNVPQRSSAGARSGPAGRPPAPGGGDRGVARAGRHRGRIGPPGRRAGRRLPSRTPAGDLT
jgi:hypothetical protein